jgi:hypothetical protein
MKRIFLLLLTITIFQISALSQTRPDNAQMCPRISATSPPDISKILLFKAGISNEFDISKLKIEWSVTNGEIIEGQSTLSIKVKQFNECATNTASIKFIGLPESCINTISVSYSPACDRGILVIDEYGKIPFENEKSRLEKLSVELQNYSETRVFIEKSFPRNITKTTSYRKLQQILDYLVLRGIEKKRIFFGVLYDSKEEQTRFFIIPPALPLPEYMHEIVDSTNLSEKLKTIRRKSKQRIK